MYVFGFVNSRRFGLSLGVDVVGAGERKCNFDCLYCELSPAAKVSRIENAASVDTIVREVKEALSQGSKPEVITVTANGEPTLYPYLEELAIELNAIKGDSKLLILSNGSTIVDTSVCEALSHFDIVKLSLDCATQECFKKLDRPQGVQINSIIEGMKSFRRRFDKELVIEVLVVGGQNDKESEFDALAEALQEISPNRVDIGTVDRPPAFDVRPVEPKRLYELASRLEGLCVSVVSRSGAKPAPSKMDKNAILALLANRPMTLDDVQTLLDEPSTALFWELEKDGTVTHSEVAGLRFYRLSSKIAVI